MKTAEEDQEAESTTSCKSVCLDVTQIVHPIAFLVFPPLSKCVRVRVINPEALGNVPAGVPALVSYQRSGNTAAAVR